MIKYFIQIDIFFFSRENDYIINIKFHKYAFVIALYIYMYVYILYTIYCFHKYMVTYGKTVGIHNI